MNLRRRGYLAEGELTPKEKKRWISDLERMSKFKVPGKNKIKDIRRYENGDTAIICGDELSMYRIAAQYGQPWKNMGHSSNLGGFFVMLKK